MRTAAAIFVAMSLPTLSGAESMPLKLVQTIPLPGLRGRFDHFSIDAKGNRLFVAALGNNSLEVIDLAAARRIQSLVGMSKPTGVLFLPESNQVLVANGDDGTIKIIDGGTYKVSHNLPGLPDADNLRFDSKTKVAWLGYGEGTMANIDPAAAKILASVKLAAHPESFQIEDGGNRVFVNVPDAKQVAVIDREKRSLITVWPMETFQANFPMALNETDRRLFIGCRKPGRLVVFDTSTGKQVSDLQISGDTDDLFYDPVRQRLYVSCGEGFIDVVQASRDTYQRTARLPTNPGARTSFFSPHLDRYYLAVPEQGNHKAEIRVYQPQ
jgi:DNA-binding beta-propeller fold protein YncE